MTSEICAYTSSTGIRVGRRPWTLVLLAVGLAWILGLNAASVRGQDNPLEAIGIPHLRSMIPVPSGFIDTASGNLHLEIPISSAPQRGVSNKITLVYDSNYYRVIPGAWWWWGPSASTDLSRISGSSSYPYIQGWRLEDGNAGVGYTDSVEEVCYDDGQSMLDTFTNWFYQSPDGAIHTFDNASTQIGFNDYYCGDNTGSSILTSDAFADDGSGYHLYIQNGIDGFVYAPDGTLVGTASYGLPQPIDTNGNYVSGSLTDYTPSRIDTLGRSISATMSGNTLTISVPNSQGTTSNYVLTLEKFNVHTNCGSPYYYEFTGSINVIQSIMLPDGTSYSFGYDSGTTAGNYGQIISMTLPTGSTIHYSYANFTDSTYLPHGHITRMVSTMTTPDGEWTFTPAVVTQCTYSAPANCQQTLTVSKPAYNGRTDNIVFLTVINPGTADLIEADYYTGSVSSTNLAASLTQSFYRMCNINGHCGSIETAETISLPTVGGTSLHQTTQYCFDPSTSDLLYKWEWNFYTGSVLHDPNPPPNCSPYSGTTPDRTTTFTYLNGANYLSNGRNIADRPVSVVLTDSSGSIVSKTLYFYDGSALVTSGAAGVKNHDDTNYSSSLTYRGNLTQVQRLVSGTSNYVTKSMTYDISGQKRTETDWNNNPTTYSYADNLFTDAGNSSAPSSYSPSTPTNAYLYTITHPTVNSVTLIDTFGYYWGTGQKALSKDPNNETTYFHFYDSMNRPTSTKFPNQYNSSCCGWIYSVYPSSSETQVDTGTGITSTSLSISCTGSSGDCRHDQTQLDGLGRVSSQILVSDPDGQTTASIAYDSNGRVYSVSNPHRSGSSPTDGTEYYAYDGMDRKIQTTRADGSIAYTYFGAAAGSNGGRSSQLCSGLGYPVLAVDEAGKKRQSWTDGFGRLIEVDEPDPSTGSLTSGSYAGTCYSFDLNNNLTGVAQGSQTRSFSYDLLSRLTTATNPESGTINYYYTTSGGSLCSGDLSAVCRRTDARSITTTYAYDALNRLISKSYSESTPEVKYGYDAVAPSGCTPPTLTITNGKGRRTSMCDGLGATAWSYDAVGNVLTEKRTTNSVTNTFTYTYNLDSTVATVAYPSGRTITYQVGGAQRSLSAKDVSNGIDYAKGVSSPYFVSYAPQGAVQLLQNGSSLISTSFYNNRLQPCRISIKNSGTAPTTCADNSSTGNVMDLVYVFNGGSSDNGNVIGITNKIDSTRSQTFTYDSLNRIATAAASTYATSPSHCWGESFTIDRYGNLTGIGSISSSYNGCTQENLSISVSSSTNRITTSGFTYDSSGNLTSDGTLSPQYDAENRISSVGGVMYYYDADGKRVRKSSGTLYWYGTSPDPLLETDDSGNLVNEYIFFGGKRIARRDVSGNVNYYFADHLGTARVVTNASGTVQDDSDFYPYGGERPVTGPSSGNHYKFTGKERDSESGLDNFGARYNSSQYGRFMTPDPLLNSGRPDSPQSWNRYTYALNNPLVIVDPTGLYNLINTCFEDDDTCNRRFREAARSLNDAVTAINNAIAKMKDGAEKTRLQAAMKALGTENDKNNVTVKFGILPPDVAGHTDTIYNSNGSLSFNVTFDPRKIGSMNAQGIDAAHEGTHIADISDPRYNNPATTLSDFSLEYRGYETSAWAAQALREPSLRYGRNVIWNDSWKAVDRMQLMDRGITNYLTTRPTNPLQETQPHNPWPN